jgi:hypothetical protein
VIDRIDDVVVYTIHAISIIPFFSWLTRSVITEVRSCVYFIVDLIIVASPITNLHFIVCVVGSRIVNINIARLVRSPRVSFPEVTVNQARLNASPISFEVTNQSRDNM